MWFLYMLDSPIFQFSEQQHLFCYNCVFMSVAWCQCEDEECISIGISVPCRRTVGKNVEYCSGNPLLGVRSGALSLKAVSVLLDRSVMGCEQFWSRTTVS